MAQIKGKERAADIQNMFARIAGRYDLVNRLMTGGQDLLWRKRVIQCAKLNKGDYVLDIGTGTGGLAREALAQSSQAKVIASDFTLEMMRVGQGNGPLNFATADALNLPYEDETFDAVVSGFLMRNVIDLSRALQEQHRVLKSRGRIVILDTTRPKKNILSPLIWLHMHLIIPALGRLLTGSSEAYCYLPDSTESFLTAEDLASNMIVAGFKNVTFQHYMFGTIAIHWAEK